MKIIYVFTIRSPHQKLTEKLNSGFDDDEEVDDNDERAGAFSEAWASIDKEATVDEGCRQLSTLIFFSSLYHPLWILCCCRW